MFCKSVLGSSVLVNCEIREGVAKWGTADDIIELTPGCNLKISLSTPQKVKLNITIAPITVESINLSNSLPFTDEML